MKTICVLASLPLFALAPIRQDAPAGAIPAAPAAPLLEVRALANEGFLLRAGDELVLIDAFVAEPYVGYAALEGEALESLLAAEGPFASADLALTSHHHADHFQPDPARRFLASAPECRFVSSPQVCAELQSAGELAHVRSVLPEPGKEERLELGGIRVDFLRLSHGTGRFASIQNLGHVITIGGVTALHVGDAAMDPETFAAYELGARGIDLAFVPHWYFTSAAGLRIVTEHLRPARLVACHIAPHELEAVAERLAEEQPDVLVPKRPLERFDFRDEHEATR
jgi:L-ascorbate metabolism protein UlaG (beta-lactamase superfamily)